MKNTEQKEDRNKISKHRSLADCLQNLYQTEASGDKVRARMWKAIIEKIKSQDKK